MSQGADGALLLEVENLHVAFAGDRGAWSSAVSGVSFALGAGRMLGVVGESGSGKSVTALSILRLLPKSGARISGSIRFQGRELLTLPEPAMRDLRGNRIAMIFQEPMTSLNPSFTIGNQIAEALVRHQRLGAKAARAAAVDLLDRVQIPAPDKRVDDYPHQLSGGMRQRAMIAMALACQPALLIADEPTTALDVTIQAQILDLLAGLRRETGAAIILITHDLGVVAETCDEVAVMYAGEVVEQAPTAEIFERPQHPYTVGLLGAIPRMAERRDRLTAMGGQVPSRIDAVIGCRFAARCPFVEPRCTAIAPQLVPTSPAHISRCWRAPLEHMELSK